MDHGNQNDRNFFPLSGLPWPNTGHLPVNNQKFHDLSYRRRGGNIRSYCPEGLFYMNKWQPVVKVIEKVTEILSGHLQAWLIFLLMIMLLIEVLTRYILRSPLSIAEEYGGYLLVAITFMGLAYTWKERGHVHVGLFINRLPQKVKQRIRFITLILATLFTLPLIKGSYDLLTDSLLFEARSGSWLRTPLVYPQTILIIGSIMLFLQLLAEIIKAMMKIKKSEEEN
jgi:TRAP-type C4-dicarboxylate transport system permease small subunit